MLNRRGFTHGVYTKGNICYVIYVKNNMYTLCVTTMCKPRLLKCLVKIFTFIINVKNFMYLICRQAGFYTWFYTKV